MNQKDNERAPLTERRIFPEMEMTVCLVFQTVWSGVKTINYTG